VTLRPYQRALVGGLHRAVKEGADAVLMQAPTGCHRVGQPVLMFDGSTKRVENVAVGDLVIHPTEEGVTFDTLVVGQTDQDGGSLERLRYRFILAVEYVNSTDPDTGETIVHVEGEDFDLDGQRIVWTDDGNAPAEGQPYQVRYRHRAEYLIGPRAPQRRHDGANLLPWTAPVTRYDPMTRAEGQGLGEGSA
jgi:hypothetical protein